VAYADVHRALTSRFRSAIFFEMVEQRTEIVILGRSAPAVRSCAVAQALTRPRSPT
jgi:hypothetical protein